MVFTANHAVLSYKFQTVIDDYWNSLLSSGKKFSRGNVFTIRSIEDQNETINIYVDQTDYAHYLASLHVPEIAQECPCRVMHTSVLIHSSDDFLIFGEMAEHTASPGRLQCAGGGITKDDLQTDQTFNVTGNAVTELWEETGFLHTDPSQIQDVKFAYLKSGGPRNFIGALHVASSPLTADQIMAFFTDFNQTLRTKNEEPELVRLIAVPNTIDAVEKFLSEESRPIDEYLPELLRTHARLTTRIKAHG